MPPGTENGEWRYYGGDAGSLRYSPLDQIDATNVAELAIAWQWSSESLDQGDRPDSYLRTTPLKVGDRLFATAGRIRSVVALDPATGETLWVFTPEESPTAGRSRGGSGRGVAYWSDGATERLFFISRAFQLFALDPETGALDTGFGEGGRVDLTVGVERYLPDSITSTSPPIPVGDVLVVGSTFPASTTRKEAPPGDVRGFDARTGELLWTFHTIPRPGELGHETWEEDSWEYTGNTGAWAPLSADVERGLVYLPLETPTVDMYGGHRPGDNLFAESLVCLDAKTGERVWHFQFIHHGIWDYDIPTQPILADLVVDGRQVPAVLQVTKQGWVYVFDRVTGEPVWPIEEREVPQSDVPGEKTSPTQPHPTWPLPFDRQGVSEDDLIDFTPELRAEAVEILQQFRYGPIFTPPSLVEEGGTQGTIILPAIMGGANWPGAALDPETNRLFVPSVTFASVLAVGEPDPARSNLRYNRVRGGEATGPQGLPLIKPPWGRITAIDMNTGEHLWMVPNGETPESVRDHPALEGVDVPKTGRGGRAGVLVTRTLLFAGEGPGMYAEPEDAGGPMFRAYDKETGEVLAEIELPGNQTSVPMSYEHEGRQYLLLGVGQRREPGQLVALALPEE